MRKIKKSVLASALALALGTISGPAAAQFSSFYFMGDSLTDAGTECRDAFASHTARRTATAAVRPDRPAAPGDAEA